jgi:hypothetical protein
MAMCTLLPTLLCTLLLAADDSARTERPHKPNPLAPSLRELTEEEEAQVEQVIDRFIEYDSGQLRGVDGKQIKKEFDDLGPDAIPALIRGLNKAAKIEHSCPSVTIRNKLRRMFMATKDLELLEFARENIGAGVGKTPHSAMLADLRVFCMLRKRAVQQTNRTTLRAGSGLRGTGGSGPDSGQKSLRLMTISELVEAAGSERGSQLKLVLTELGRRRGDQVIGALGSAAATYDGDVQKLARDLLNRQLSALKTDALKAKLKDDRAEVKAAAARVAANKGLHWEAELIELLTDDEEEVRKAAHQALVKLNKGTDFGPRDSASAPERKEAALKWQAWLDRQNGR